MQMSTRILLKIEEGGYPDGKARANGFRPRRTLILRGIGFGFLWTQCIVLYCFLVSILDKKSKCAVCGAYQLMAQDSVGQVGGIDSGLIIQLPGEKRDMVTKGSENQV